MSPHATVAPAVLNSAEIADLAERVARVLLPDEAGYHAECATSSLMTPVTTGRRRRRDQCSGARRK